MEGRTSRWLEAVGWVATGGMLGLIVSWIMFAGFMPYDDEGYVQWSLRQVAAGKPLYDEVFSQYGPFFHSLHVLLGKAGYPFTSDSARLMAMIYWLGTAAGCGWLTRRLTRNAALGMVGMVLSFVSLTQMRMEPGHPGGMLALLSALSACIGVHWIEKDRPKPFGIWQAAITACMVWTKINVGVLQLIAVVTWWPFAMPKSVSESTRRLVRCAIVVIGGGVLVGGLMQHREVQAFLIFFVCAAGGLAWTWPAHPSPHTQAWPHLGAAALAFLAVSLAACVPVLIGGTGLGELLNGTILGPIRHPAVYHYLVPWRTADLIIIAVAVLAVGMFKTGPVKWRGTVLRATKWIALILLAEAVFKAHFGNIERTMFMRLPLFAWALATPLGDIDPLRRQARHWLAWLLCWSWLQAFPVAGTQYVWGSFLAIPLALVGVQDLVRGRSRVWFTALLSALTVYTTAHVAYYARLNQKLTVPLDLPGARMTRVFSPTASTYRLMVKNVRSSGDRLFTFPGMLSFNQWSGLEPPTHANATHWFSLLNEKQQREIIHELRETRHPLIIVCRSQIRYLINQDLAPQGPLKEFVLADFEPGMRIGDYDVWKPRGAPFTPVSCARLINGPEPTQGADLVLLTDADRQIARLEMVDLGNPSVILHARDASPTAWRQTELPARLQPPHAPAPVHRLVIPVEPDAVAIAQRENIEFILRDRAGLVLDRLRLDRAPRPAEAFNASTPQ